MRKLSISVLTTFIFIALGNTLFAQGEIALEEVVVKPNNARSIVKEALNSISENYGEQANYLKVDYEESVEKDNTLINHNKAISLLYNQAYQHRFNFKSAYKSYHDKREVELGDFVAARWYNELTDEEEKAKILYFNQEVNDKSEIMISGGPAGLLAYDKVKYNTHFLGQGKNALNHYAFKNHFKSYNFEFIEEDQINSRPVYVIAFSPKKTLSRKADTFEGKMYIDIDTKAFVGFDYQNVSGQKIKYTFDGKVIKNQIHKVNIRYALSKGKWQLSEIRVSDRVDVYGKKDKLESSYKLSSSIKVNEVITDNVRAFSSKEALSNSMNSALSTYTYESSVATR